MSVERGEAKGRSLQRRAHGPKAPRILTSGAVRGLRGVVPGVEGYVVLSKSVPGRPLSVPSALGAAALRALSSEQPRPATADEVYRGMTPSRESTGWGKELAEDRESIVAENPWEGR
ncbi:MAG: hypothetical protein MOP51_1298 [Citricoccus sp.]|nr:hypothetical protein [Citricoccus sp. WCRC_4]